MEMTENERWWASCLLNKVEGELIAGVQPAGMDRVGMVEMGLRLLVNCQAWLQRRRVAPVAVIEQESHLAQWGDTSTRSRLARFPLS